MGKGYRKISAIFSLVVVLSLTACRDKSIPGAAAGGFGMNAEVVELDKEITFTASVREESAPRWIFHKDNSLGNWPEISWERFTMSSYIYLYSSFDDNDGYYYVYRTVDPVKWTVVDVLNTTPRKVTLKPKDEFGLTRKWYKIVVNKNKVPLSEWNQAKYRNPKYTQGTVFYALAVATPLEGEQYQDGIPTNQQSFEFYQDGFSRDASAASRYADLKWNVPYLLIDQLGKDIYPIETEAGNEPGAVGHVRGSDLFEMSRFTKSSVDEQGKLKFDFLFEPVGNMILVEVKNRTRATILDSDAVVYLRMGSSQRKRYLFNPRDLKANGWEPKYLLNYSYAGYDTRRWQNIEAIKSSTDIPEGAFYSAFSPQYTEDEESEGGWDKQLSVISSNPKARGVTLHLLGDYSNRAEGKFKNFNPGDTRTFFVQTAQPLFMESMAYNDPQNNPNYFVSRTQDKTLVMRTENFPTNRSMYMVVKANGYPVNTKRIPVDNRTPFSTVHKVEDPDLKSNGQIYTLTIILEDMPN